MAILRVEHLYKEFAAPHGRGTATVLDDVSFELAGQVFVSLVGPSGCGKTTLLNIVSGVETASAGRVTTTSEGGEAARLGYVFQEPRLLPWRTVIENLLYARGDDSKRSREVALHYLRMVRLEGVADIYPSRLSGGMQQRVGIARAFGVDPDLLLMDEPFSHLDAITARALRAELQQIWDNSKKTVLFVTHDVVEAVQLSDRVIVFAPGGRIQADIPIDLPHPRKLSDRKVAVIQADILGTLESVMAAETPAEPAV